MKTENMKPLKIFQKTIMVLNDTKITLLCFGCNLSTLLRQKILRICWFEWNVFSTNIEENTICYLQHFERTWHQIRSARLGAADATVVQTGKCITTEEVHVERLTAH